MKKTVLLLAVVGILLANASFVSTTYADEQGQIQIMVMNSPPTPPVDVSHTIVTSTILSSGSPVMLDGVPTSEWTYGCTATSAGMLFGYYDRHGYPNMYTGPTGGGVCPLTDLGQGIPTNPRYPIPGSCYIIATEQGLDGIAARAHVDDYWIGYDLPGPDPWEGNWAEHTWGLCTADYLGTNQWKWDLSSYPGTDGNRDTNTDGSTVYWTMSDGSKLYDWTPGPAYGTPETACSRGMRLFAASRGYTVLTNYNQLTDNQHASGFTFAEFQAEIDAGRPVLIHGSDPTNGGHTMLALGYDTSTNLIYIHNTWDNELHNMTWGGSYAGYTLRAVTVIHLQAVADMTPPTTTKTVGSPQYGSHVTTSTPITLTATDNPGGSGVKEIHYVINGAEAVAPGDTVTFYFAGECAHDLEYWAVDNAGCVETPHTQTHYVDDTPPTTTKSYGTPYYNDGTNEWVTSATPVTLSASDSGACPSGMATTKWRVGLEPWHTYVGPFTMASYSEGAHTIQYYSTDYLGNTETTHSQTVWVDDTPPTTTFTIGWPYYFDGVNYYVSPTTPLTLSAFDAGCGVASTEYGINGGPWIIYTGPFSLAGPDGTYTIDYRSTDNLGNTETTGTAQVILFNWDYEFEDTFGRGTILKINIAHKFIQLITPDKDYGIRQATRMWVGKTIVIYHVDTELRLIAFSVNNTKRDYCIATGWGKSTGRIYLLDKPGIE